MLNQSTASSSDATPPEPSHPRAGNRAWERATVLAAGTSFALAAVVPGALEPGSELAALAGWLAPLLLAGLLAPRASWSPVGLLVVFPWTVLLSLAVSGGSTPSPLAIGMIAVTWGTYGVLAVRLLRPPPTWESAAHPIADSLPDEPRRPRITRALYWASLLVGAVGLAMVAPALGSDAVYRASWGEASGAARVLVAVVGGAVAVGAVATIVAPGLRQRSPEASQTVARTRRRALLYLCAAVAFGVVLWFIEQRAPR